MNIFPTSGNVILSPAKDLVGTVQEILRFTQNDTGKQGSCLSVAPQSIEVFSFAYAPDVCTDYICDFMTRNKAIDDVEKSGSLRQPSGNR